MTNSAIYEGFVRHRRYTPKYHGFIYRVFMVYLDLDELDDVFSKTCLWSNKGFSVSWFKRKDFFDGDENRSLYDAVADQVESELDFRPQGRICMLANLRYFGYLINPIVCYYCFDESGDNLQAVVAEVTNTPWGERCHYVLDMRKQPQHTTVAFDKAMHVSPFQPMNLVYHWRGKQPNKNLLIHFDVFSKTNSDKEKAVFDATLTMKRHEMTASSMRKFVLRYPLMTVKVFAAIYWQAVKLWFKGISFLDHPTSTINNNEKTSSVKFLPGDNNESSQC